MSTLSRLRRACGSSCGATNQEPARREEFTGQVWHTWLLRREPAEGRWRVAAQIVDGFAELNDNAATLFGAPTEGQRT